MNKKRNTIILTICLLVITIMFSFFSLNKEIEITFGNKVIEYLEGETLYFSKEIDIETNGTIYVNGEKVENTISFDEDGIYKVKVQKGFTSTEFEINYTENPLFEIVNYSGGTIHNYESNKLPFKIETDENIKVNEEFYDGAGFYALGSYKLEIADKIYEVNINNITKDKEYNFYLTSYTLPTLYAALDFVKKDDYKYIWYYRMNTIYDESLLKLDNIELSGFRGSIINLNNNLMLLNAKITNILRKDPDAFFNFYFSDAMHWAEYIIAMGIGLDDHRYNVYYYSDGTASYVYNQKYDKEEFSDFEKDITEYETFIDNIRKNKITNTDLKSNINIDETFRNYNEYFYPSLLRDNVYYYLMYPKYLGIENSDVSAILDDVNYITKTPQDMYQSLTEEEKQKFLSVINFEKESFDKEYNLDNTNKKIVITGTNPIDNKKGYNNFETLIKYVNEKYGEEYQIYFKPHPAHFPEGEYLKLLEDNKITILPGKLPMEAITFIYSDLYLGGYNSSLYLSANPDKVLFFFAKDKDDIYEPLNILSEKEYTSLEFIDFE